MIGYTCPVTGGNDGGRPRQRGALVRDLQDLLPWGVDVTEWCGREGPNVPRDGDVNE